MGAKPNLAICGYCGRILPRTKEMDTSFIKCLECQREGKTELLDLQFFLEHKKAWLRRLEHDRTR